ncbi:MAG: cache domain-containing protein [Enhydrobacter sp.]
MRAQSTVARLRAQQIDRWILQHTMDAQALAQSMKALPLNPLTPDQQTQQIVGVLLGEVLAGSTDRTGISVLSPEGKVLIGVGEDADPDEETLKAVTTLKTSAARFQIIDVHAVKGSKPLLRMAFVVPVDPGNGTGPPTMVVVVLTVDPARELFSQVATWPVDTPGSEVVLVRRDGDELVFLTGPTLLADKQVAPLSFRLPMSRIGLPEVQAILHGDATREGLDYRGIRVFSASHHVTGVPWFVVAKTDVDVLMAPIWDKTRALVLVVGAVILITIFMVLLLWRAQRESYISFRELQIEERAAQAKHFEELIRLARSEAAAGSKS